MPRKSKIKRGFVVFVENDVPVVRAVRIHELPDDENGDHDEDYVEVTYKGHPRKIAVDRSDVQPSAFRAVVSFKVQQQEELDALLRDMSNLALKVRSVTTVLCQLPTTGRKK